MEAAPIDGLVHPLKTEVMNGGSIHTCTSVEAGLAAELPTHSARVRVASVQSLRYVEMNLG